MFTYFRGSGVQLLELLKPDNREMGDLERDFVKCYNGNIHTCNFYETEGERLGKIVMSPVGHPFHIHELRLFSLWHRSSPRNFALCSWSFID